MGLTWSCPKGELVGEMKKFQEVTVVTNRQMWLLDALSHTGPSK
jgi:hypothetical protein